MQSLACAVAQSGLRKSNTFASRIYKISLAHGPEVAQSPYWRTFSSQPKRLPNSQQRSLVPLLSQLLLQLQLLLSHCRSQNPCLSQRARLLQLVGFHLCPVMRHGVHACTLCRRAHDTLQNLCPFALELYHGACLYPYCQQSDVSKKLFSCAQSVTCA